MTIDNSYLTIDGVAVTQDVYIGAARMTNVSAIQWDYGIAQVPTATIRLNGTPPAGVVFNASVRVDVGFNGENVRVFTGRVVHVNPNERHTIIECQGYSLWLDVNYHKVVQAFQNITAATAITNMLIAAGVPAYDVNVPAWTIGTVPLSDDPDEAYATIEFETYGEAIMKVGEPDGSRWMELPTGTIFVRPLDPIPALTSWRTYFSSRLSGIVESLPAGVTAGYRPRLRRINSSHQLREVKNQAFVQGATILQVNPDGTQDGIDIEADAKAPSPWVVNFDGTQAYNDLLFTHELIDTVAKASEVAGRLVGVNNRLNDLIDMTVDGDPQITLGRTIKVVDRDYSRIDARYFVEAYSSILDVDAEIFETNITAIGGSESGGVVNVAPFALFSHAADREVIGDRVWVVLTLDGSGSLDVDGEIVSWVWSGDVSGTGKTLHTRIDPSLFPTGEISVTLTVTDDQGSTDAITLTIAIEAGAEFLSIPAMIVANGDWFSFSPDGGITWNDKAVPGSEQAISCGTLPPDGATFGVGWWGTDDSGQGRIYRTTDFAVTAPSVVFGPVSSPFVHVWPDLNHLNEVLAVTRDGRLYRSQDRGAVGTWALWDDMRTKFGLPALVINRIATPPPDGYWLFGGEGNGLPLICWDGLRNHGWTKAALGGELLSDLGLGGTPPLSGYSVKAGSYVGDSTNPRAFTGVGFQPEFLIIFTATGEESVVRAAGWAQAHELNGGASVAITSLDADGFTLTNSTKVNQTGITYYYLAIRGGSSLIKTGSYVGTGAGGSVTGVPFAPVMAMACNATSGNPAVRTSTMDATESCELGVTTAFVTNEITVLDASGFTYGTGGTMSGAGQTVEWITFGAASNFVMGEYTGDATDNRTIDGGTYDAAFVMADRADAGGKNAYLKPSSLAGDSALEIDFSTHDTVANAIQSLSPFQIGSLTQINNTGTGFHYFLFGVAAVGGTDPTLMVADAANTVKDNLAIILNSLAHTPAVYLTTNIFGPGSDWKRATGAPAKAKGRWMTPNLGALGASQIQFGFDDHIVYLGDISAGVIATTVAAAALDATDDANHGLALGAFLGGIGGAHLIAAEGSADGTIYKTWDRFGNIAKVRPATGFPASPAGANAKMVNVSAAGFIGETNLDERIAAIGLDVSPRDFSKLLGLGAAWSAPTSVTGVTGNQPSVWPLTEDLMFVANHDWTDTDQSSQGVGARSVNGGATWAATPTPPDWVGTSGVAKIQRDAGGRVWMLYQTGAGDNVTKVAYSDNDGATWTLSDTFATGGADVEGWELMCHPSNQNIIAVIAVQGFISTGFIAVTLNRGASAWTKNYPSAALLRTGARETSWHAILTPQGRIVGSTFTGTTLTVWYTDDYGATALHTIMAFTAAGADHDMLGFWMNGPGDKVAFLVEDDGDSSGTYSVRLYLSVDGGKTFSIVSLAQELFAYLGAQLASDKGFAASPEAIYISDDTGTPNIIKLFPVSADGVWYDLDAGNYPHANVGDFNIGWIPRP